MATTIEQLKEMKRQRNELLTAGQQLFAKIKKSSEYADQRDGDEPFPVRIMSAFGNYPVQGGPGGQYRLVDVNLYIVDNGIEIRIS